MATLTSPDYYGGQWSTAITGNWCGESYYISADSCGSVTVTPAPPTPTKPKNNRAWLDARVSEIANMGRALLEAA